jgi:TRAP-type C4-dicarboxylate transport system substrate-binding protein
MNSRVRWLLVVVAASLMVVALAAQGQVTLRLAHYNPESHAKHAA